MTSPSRQPSSSAIVRCLEETEKGCRNDSNSGEPKLAALSRVVKYRNPSVVRRFCTLFDLDAGEATTLFVSVLKFLWLGAMARRRGVDPPSVFGFQAMMDEMWHNFILFSRDYQEFALEFLGEVPRHQPEPHSSARSPEEETALLRYNIELVYDHLGYDTAVEWFEEWPCRYSPQAMDRLRRSYEEILSGSREGD